MLSPHPWGAACPSSLLLLAASHQTLCTHPRVPQGRLRSSEHPPEDLPGRRRSPAHPQERVWPAPCCKKDFFFALGLCCCCLRIQQGAGTPGRQSTPSCMATNLPALPLAELSSLKSVCPLGGCMPGVPFQQQVFGVSTVPAPRAFCAGGSVGLCSSLKRSRWWLCAPSDTVGSPRAYQTLYTLRGDLWESSLRKFQRFNHQKPPEEP